MSMVSNGSDDGGAEGGGSTASEIIVLVFIVLGLGRVHYRRTLRQRRKDAARQLCPDGLALPLDPTSSHPNAPVARHDPLSEPVASTGSSPHPSQDGIGAMTADRRLAEGRRMHLRLVGLDRYMSPGNMVSASTANADCAEIVDLVPSNAVGTTASRHEQAQRPRRATEVGGGTAVARGAPSSHRAYENVPGPEAPEHAGDPHDTVDAHQSAPPGHPARRVLRHTNRAVGAHVEPAIFDPATHLRRLLY